MTVRHIVTWKLSGESVAERDAQFVEIEAALTPLLETIPGLRTLEVFRNALNHDANWDVTLLSEHDDAEALAAYAVHPDHVAAGAVVKRYSVSRAAVDAIL
ncbi:Dabb family protein [Leucobacter sp. GX24907]